MSEDTGKDVTEMSQCASTAVPVSAEDDWRRLEYITGLLMRRCQGTGQRAALALVAVLAGGHHRREMLNTLGSLAANCDEGEIYAHLVDIEVDGVELDPLRRETRLRFVERLLDRAVRIARRQFASSMDAAEDLAHDVLASMDFGTGAKAVSLWRVMYKAVSYHWLNRVKRRNPEILFGLDVGLDLASNESMEERLEQREDLRRVLKVIQGLPAKQREHLIRVIESPSGAGDCSPDDTTGIRRRAAEKRAVTRARNTLQKQARVATDDTSGTRGKSSESETELEENK